MNRKFKYLVTLSIALMIMICVATVYGGFQDSASVTNHIMMGDVNIGIKEYAIEDDQEIPYEGMKVVLPGDSISKIPRITNIEEPSYIRVKMIYRNISHDAEELESLIHFHPDWLKRGGYYYYTKPLDTEATVELFDRIDIPGTWGNEMSEKDFTVEIAAQAIQAAHFTPDFDKSDPWGDQIILKCIHEENNRVKCEKSNIALSLELNGESGKILIVPEDFFVNFSQAMPGDTMKDSVDVNNTTDETLRLYFKTSHQDASEQQYQLMKQIHMTIYRGDQKVYQGNMASDLLEKELCLMELSPGEKSTLTFELVFPIELDNTYALADGIVHWIFRAQTVEESITSNVQSHKNGNATGKMTSKKTKQVKTSDDTKIDVWIYIMVLSFGITIFSLWKRKGGKHSEESK